MPNSHNQYNPKADQNQHNESWREFSISRFHLFRHIAALFLTSLFCLSLFMSELNRYIQKHELGQINHITFIYLVLLVFIILMGIVAVLSVRKVRVYSDKIELSNLFWKEKLCWKDITIHCPRNLRFAWIKGKNCPYLLVKSEFKNYSELEYSLAQYGHINN